jgi:hypothetical protein
MTSRILPAVLAALGLLATAAQAQAPQQIPEENPCVDGRQTLDGTPCQTLSDKLDETGGIITPPTGVDPEIHTPAPDPMPGTTPVIPPSAVQPNPDTDGIPNGSTVIPK